MNSRGLLQANTHHESKSLEANRRHDMARPTTPVDPYQAWTIGDLLHLQAERIPHRSCIQMVDGPVRSYSDTFAAATRVAGGLQKLGVKAADTVVIMLRNSLDHVFTCFGVSLLGSIDVSINTAYRGAALEHAINQAQTRVLVVGAEYLPVLHASLGNLQRLETLIVVGQNLAGLDWGGVRLVDYAGLLEDADPPILPVVKRSDIASVIYTSGTTGPAKGVLMPHAQVMLLARRTAEKCRVSADDVWYCFHPMFHMAGKFMSVLGTLVAGGKLVLDDSFSAELWLKRVRDCGATVSGAHGPMLEMVHALPPTADDRSHRLRTICSAPFPRHIAHSFEERFGVRGLEVWGMTEVGIPCWSDIDSPLREGSCGRVDADWFDFRVVDADSDEPLPAGKVGEFVVRARHPWTLMQGYMGMPDKTVDAWRNLWFHTGDSGYVDADGWVYFVDRNSDRIRRRAESISSYDIEIAALKHPAIAETAAVGAPSGFAGDDDIKLCVVLKQGAVLAPLELLQHLASLLPHFMVPRYLEFLAELPRSTTNKVKRAALKAAPYGSDVWDRKQHGVSLRVLVDDRPAG